AVTKAITDGKCCISYLPLIGLGVQHYIVLSWEHSSAYIVALRLGWHFYLHDPIATKAKPTSPNARKEVGKLYVFPERYVSPIASSQPGMATV
ncbi:hypothetical protein M5D96_011524, partial [Drosophila gunungcola]